MKRIFVALFLLASPAFAADNTIVVTPGSGVTMKSKDVGAGIQAMQPILSDTSGSTLATPTAGADGVSNSTEGLAVYNFPLLWNGTTWDRWKGDATNGAFVNIKSSVSGALVDGAITTLGTKPDAKSTATDATSVSLMAVTKEISFALQNPITASATNPTSTLTLPSTTTAYTAGSLMCTSATVATCNSALASQSFSILNSAGAAVIPRIRLSTNDSTSTAWSGATIQVDLWSAAPTFATTGDRGAFTTDFATGSAGHLGAFTCIMSTEGGDGAYAECFPTVGNSVTVKLASGSSIFPTLQAVSGSGVTGASGVFTITLEVLN